MEENGHVMEVASLEEGEWSCYRSGQFKGRSMVILQRWPVECRQNGHVKEVVSLMQAERSCYRGGHFNGRRMVMLWRWPV